MEPIQYALFHQKVHEDLRREQLERHFAHRAEVREKRRIRRFRWRRPLIGRRVPSSTLQPAV